MSTLTDKISWHESKMIKERGIIEWHKNHIEISECRIKYHEAEIERLKAINDKINHASKPYTNQAVAHSTRAHTGID